MIIGLQLINLVNNSVKKELTLEINVIFLLLDYSQL